jgi:hypothetical protein
MAFVLTHKINLSMLTPSKSEFLSFPDWQGTGIVVEKRGRSAVVLIPAIALETNISVAKELSLNEELPLRIAGIDLPRLTARFTSCKLGFDPF